MNTSADRSLSIAEQAEFAVCTCQEGLEADESAIDAGNVFTIVNTVLTVRKTGEPKKEPHKFSIAKAATWLSCERLCILAALTSAVIDASRASSKAEAMKAAPAGPRSSTVSPR